MRFEIVEKFNALTTLIRTENGDLRVAKEIAPTEAVIYEKLKKIKNKNLVRVYGVFENEGKLYAVQEYAVGETIEQHMKTNGLYMADEVRKIACSLCNALDALHKKGIIHRDLSAGNVVVGENGVKIIDYGISRSYKPGKGRDTELLGTQGFAAPEQFGFGQTSPRSDIYSLGVLMNYMLSGKFPFEGIADGELHLIISKCIQTDEVNRYQSAAQLRSALRKRRLMCFLLGIPGFRTNKLYKKIIAFVYYSCVLFLYIAYFGYNADAGDVALTYVVYFITLILPVLIICDYQNWSKRLFKNMSAVNRMIIKLLLTLLCLSVVLIIPSPEI